jgi:hypothetical protein
MKQGYKTSKILYDSEFGKVIFIDNIIYQEYYKALKIL